ncbi:MAG TPA: phospholipase, partial [Burkholderiaceae bacterium]|nr:phospholipase [Burkholderiaceae bacterium]
MAAAVALCAAGAQAQTAPSGEPASPLVDAQLTWQQCTRLAADKDARLACFDRWAQQQTLPAAAVPPAPAALATAQP